MMNCSFGKVNSFSFFSNNKRYQTYYKSNNFKQIRRSNDWRNLQHQTPVWQIIFILSLVSSLGSLSFAFVSVQGSTSAYIQPSIRAISQRRPISFVTRRSTTNTATSTSVPQRQDEQNKSSSNNMTNESETNNDSNLVAIASSWCASHGVLMGARKQNKKEGAHEYVYEPAPFSLHPSPFPKTAFDKATKELGYHFNHMVHAIAEQYEEWLRPTIMVAAASDKEFTGRLVKLADEVHATVKEGTRAQNVALGLFRSDYMLHNTTDPKEEPYPLQVELNTIASSFGCLSTKLSQMHKHLGSLPSTSYNSEELPNNDAAPNIAGGLAAAYKEYQKQHPQAINPVVIMVVQPGETNSCDQRDLEFLLQETHGVRMIRKTLHDFATTAKYSDDTTKNLQLPDDDGSTIATAAVVYYRAGYTPNDYPTDVEWQGRTLVEHSSAIKSPDIFYHLVGTKKVQQALAIPGVLRQFVTSDDIHDVLYSSFADLYSLGEGDDSEVVKMALERPNDFVLKPQREGGGNNLYDDELVQALQTMTYEERGAYILMQKIRPPSYPGKLVRGGTILYDGDTVCELGVFGVSLRQYYHDKKILMDIVGGHILRSKSIETDEGGVAAGYAFLSSPILT